MPIDSSYNHVRIPLTQVIIDQKSDWLSYNRLKNRLTQVIIDQKSDWLSNNRFKSRLTQVIIDPKANRFKFISIQMTFVSNYNKSKYQLIQIAINRLCQFNSNLSQLVIASIVIWANRHSDTYQFESISFLID